MTVQQLGAGAVMNVATSTGSSALFVSSTGQVGVGTTSPAYALDVYTGTMNAATVVATTLTGAGSGITALNMGNAGSGTLAVARGGTGTTTSTGTGSVVLSASPALSGTATFAAITTSGNVGIGYYSPQSILHVQVGDVVPTASGNMATGMIISQASYGPAMCLGARTTGGNYTWIHSAYTNNSGVAAPLVLQPIGGNVGIGTTNPAYTLDIGQFGSSTYTLRLAAASTTAGTMGTSIRMMEANDTYGFSFQNLSASRLGIFRHSASSTGSEILTIMRDNPYVGIGTAGPGYLLQVNSAATGSETVAAFLKPSMATGGTFAGIQVGGAIAIGGAGAMGFLNYGTNASNVFQLSLNGSGGSAININSTGVGIGTTNPGPMLDIWATGTTFQTSGSLRFYRSDAGSFWKFTGPDTGNSLYLLNAGGVGVSITNGSTSWAAASDSRIKNIIEPISNALSKVELLNPVLYSWKNDETNEPHPGLIAQDVLKVQPEAVSSDKDGMYGVRYTELVPLAFAAITEISAKNAALEARLAALEQSLATATANNSSLESKLAA